jgi:hypothetical protein
MSQCTPMLLLPDQQGVQEDMLVKITGILQVII